MSQDVTISPDFLCDLSQFPLPAGAGDAKVLIGQLASMTKDVFECDVQVSDDGDPELPEDRHIVFIVCPHASNEQLVKMEAEWVKRLRTLAPDWEAVRLSIRLPE